eukprot:scaffold4916_cov371-Prasinococcus_capsulatus_cf.AAC.5
MEQTRPITPNDSLDPSVLDETRKQAQTNLMNDYRMLLSYNVARPDVVLFGGSTAECWHGSCLGNSCSRYGERCHNAPAIWQEFFASYSTVNLGLDGDSIEDVAQKIVDFGIYSDLHPRALVLFLDDSLEDTDTSKTNGLRALVDSLSVAHKYLEQSRSAQYEDPLRFIVVPGSDRTLRAVRAPACRTFRSRDLIVRRAFLVIGGHHRYRANLHYSRRS